MAWFLTRIIHERLLQRPTFSPGGAFLVRSPRRTATAKGTRTGRLTRTRPAHHLAGVHRRDAPYSARRGPRRRAQTWRALFIAVRFERSHYSFGLRFATYS